MATFLCKTKGGAGPQGKPRVYFTCHPEDFDKYFERVCADIFKTHDCAIYYTESMTEPIEEQYLETDLGRMNLVVIPVTFKLLHEHNRAMRFDFPYAKEHHIPVLPIMMEHSLDDIYDLEKNFGELQYLDPNARDLTAIGYEEKLQKYLGAVLVSDEVAKRVRAAFDAYIFLSYRKKDRHYANELMKRIHANPEYRDIAIWYDEFLTPGESFRANIEKMMRDSKLFALLVTPSLLEYVDGAPNYVMAHEYPDAKRAGMDILPTEMVETDKDKLADEYEDIPPCVNAADEEAFRDRLAATLCKIAVSENNTDPEHNFLIGLAYLEGIDVETDRERGIALITSAAEAGLVEAMKKLYNMYQEGKSVQVDYHKAVLWAERIAEYYAKEYGEEHPDTLEALHNLAYAYGELGEHKKALELYEKVYALRCKVSGEEHPDTLTSLNNLAYTYGALGDYQKALELNERVYSLQCKVLGEEHPDTLTSLGNLATTYGNLGDYQKEVELDEKVYALLCKILGEEHPDTLTSLNNLAVTHSDLGDHQKALELIEKVYALRCKVSGEEHPDTLTSLNNLAVTHSDLGDHQKALELKEKVYALQCKVLGEEHPDTLNSLNNLAVTHNKLGDYKKAYELQKEVYALNLKLYGPDDPRTVKAKKRLEEYRQKAET